MEWIDTCGWPAAWPRSCFRSSPVCCCFRCEILEFLSHLTPSSFLACPWFCPCCGIGCILSSLFDLPRFPPAGGACQFQCCVRFLSNQSRLLPSTHPSDSTRPFESCLWFLFCRPWCGFNQRIRSSRPPTLAPLPPPSHPSHLSTRDIFTPPLPSAISHRSTATSSPATSW